jgi:hypothetical protein
MMANDNEKFEKVLGGKVERKDGRVIPGTVQIAGQKVIYFSDDGTNLPLTQFRNLTKQINPPHLKYGGASVRGCIIKTPDNLSFHAMSYHGDLEGWHRQITEGAKELNVLTAVVEGNKFVTSDGREFLISSCYVEFC